MSTEKKFVDTFPGRYLLSSTAGIIAETVTFPVDLIKTRLQIQGEAANIATSKKLPYKGMTGTFLDVVKNEGVFALWRGMSAAATRQMVYCGSRIMIYENLRQHAFQRNADGTFAFWKSVICSCTAGATAQLIASPTDLVKVQMMTDGQRRSMGLQPRTTGVVSAFVQIYKKGGARGLWKGSIPNAQRAALANLGEITTYDMVKQTILTKTTLQNGLTVQLMSSTCAGFVSSVLSSPADVIKTRVMNQPVDEHGRGLHYKGSVDCLVKTISREGFFALYKGFIPNWMRLAPWAVTFWISFEQLAKVIGASSF